MDDIKSKLLAGNKRYIDTSDAKLRIDAATNGQHPYAIVLYCSDSRVIPEKIFDTKLGELFVIRVAGNVLDNHQLGSIEYAVSSLKCNHIIVLGHTGCGAVHAALTGNGNGFIKYITDTICEAVGSETDECKACSLNVIGAVNRLKCEFGKHPEIGAVSIYGAVYDITDGGVSWLES